MRRRAICFLVLLLFVIASNVQKVGADFGPKPSIQITIEGVESSYSFDLLSEQLDEEEIASLESEGWIDEHTYYKDEFPTSLIGFRDKDGFASYQRYNGIGNVVQENTDVYNVNYYGPNTYKLVVVMDDQTMIISKQIVNIVFDTVITWDLSEVDVSKSSYGLGELSGNMGIGTPDNYQGEGKIVWMTAWRTLLRVLATIGLELLVFVFLFKYKNRDTYRKMILVNVLSQTLLSVFLVLGYLGANIFGLLAALIIGETLVFIGEAIFYMVLFKEGTKAKAFGYAIVANSFSLMVSLFITPFLH